MEGFIDTWDDEFLNGDMPETNGSSECYVITITNTSDGKLKNVEIGAADENLYKERCGVPLELSVTCKKMIEKKEVPFSYKEFLQLVKYKPFIVGQSFIGSSMGEQSLVDVWFYHQEQWNLMQRVFDPYRSQSNIQIYKKQYGFDKHTKIMLKELFPKSNCTIYIYKQKKSNVKHKLSSYAPPQIIK